MDKGAPGRRRGEVLTPYTGCAFHSGQRHKNGQPIGNQNAKLRTAADSERMPICVAERVVGRCQALPSAFAKNVHVQVLQTVEARLQAVIGRDCVNEMRSLIDVASGG